MFPVKMILCPIDFSEPSDEALKIGVELAKRFKAALDVIHVIPPVPEYTPFPDPPVASSDAEPMHQQEMAVDTEKALIKLVEKRVPKQITTFATVLTGEAAEEIVNFAIRERIDLIIMATHGLTGWRHYVIGSVTEKVVRLSPCPVLAIREPRSGEQEK